jgi:hypothetical protein
MHRHNSRFPQVNAYFWLRLGQGIPSISTAYAQAWRRCAQVIHMFVHRQQGSSRLVCWQAARIGTGRRYLQARPTRRVRASETRWRPCRVRADFATAGLTSSAGGSQAVPLVGTDMIKVLANPNHYPLPMAGEFYAIHRLLLAFTCRLAQNLDICAMLANRISVLCEPIANRRLLKLNLARLVGQAGKRRYRRRPRGR